MALTPQITLIANLLDFSGNLIGTATQPAYLRISLVSLSAALPNVPGTGTITKVASWPGDIPFEGTALTVMLFGNDVITPSLGTYYAISVLDTNKNVVQTGCYQFTGTATVYLSDATPLNPPPTPLPQLVPVYTNPTGIFPQPQTVDSALAVNGPLSVEVTTISVLLGVANLPCNLGNAFHVVVTGSTAVNLNGATPGQTVLVMIEQNVAGGHAVTFNNITNPPTVNTSPSAQTLVVAYVWLDGTITCAA